MDTIFSIPLKDLVPGVAGHYAHGEKMSFGYVLLKKGSHVPVHYHPHEQITFILEGELDMVIDDKPCPLKAGMYHVIHSNVPHSARAVTDCKVIDVFSPAREEYKI